jgi:SagB-type dehydrogenase family enzyme
MRRRDLDYVVIAGMTLVAVYATVSGFVADLFGFPQFLLHAYAGYAWAILGIVHIALNWRRITAYVRSRLGQRRSRQVETSGDPSADSSSVDGSSKRRKFLVAALSALGGFLVGWLVPQDGGPGADDQGQRYHEWSKPGVSDLGAVVRDWGDRPEPYKTYPDAPRLALPEPSTGQEMSVAVAIAARRSQRDYTSGSLSQEALSQLLHAASGITAPDRGFRAAPSAGALYPIETYAVVRDVTGLEPGVYHYAVQEHALEQLQAGDVGRRLTVAGLGQEMLGQAQVTLVLSAIFQRTRWRYRQRAYRYVLMEAGHIGQNVYLAATAMGLGTCAIGAFLDQELNALIGVDGQEEAALYMFTVGRVD